MKNIVRNEDHTPVVTVITATYNLVKAGRVDFVRQSIESVHAQTYPRIEHLIIDGASSDGTLELLREYEEKGWLTIHSEPDTGLYDAFNKGLHHASGKYIAYLNSDDFWHDPRGVEYSVRMLEEEQADFSYAPHLFLREGAKPRKVDGAISSFVYSIPCCHQTMFVRTELLREIGGFSLKYKACSDRDSMVRLLLMGAKPVHVPLTFTSFRAGGFAETNWKNAQSAYANDHDDLYCRHFLPLVGDPEVLEQELPRLKRHLLSPAIKKGLKERLHPIVYKELDTRCQWYEQEGAWRFFQGSRNMGFLGYHAKNVLLRILNVTIPRWLEKWLSLRKIKQS